jgi:hypothetical protein
MAAHWVGLQHVEELDVAPYKATKLSKLRKERNYWYGLIAFGLVFLSLQLYAGSFDRIAIAPFLTAWGAMRLYLSFRDERRMRCIERVARTKSLTAENVIDSTSDNTGKITDLPRRLPWKDLSYVDVTDRAVYLRFSVKWINPAISLPMTMFPDRAVRDEFLTFARGVIARSGKTPKPEFIDRTVDPTLD